MSVESPIASVDASASLGRDSVTLPKSDVVVAYAFLERLVVSLDRLGSAHATQDSPTPAQHQALLEDFNRFFNDEFFRSAARARSMLRDCVDDEEGEAISDALQMYKAGGPAWQPDAGLTKSNTD